MESHREIQIIEVDRQSNSVYTAIGYHYDGGQTDWTNIEYPIDLFDHLLWPHRLADGYYTPFPVIEIKLPEDYGSQEIIDWKKLLGES